MKKFEHFEAISKYSGFSLDVEPYDDCHLEFYAGGCDDQCVSLKLPYNKVVELRDYLNDWIAYNDPYLKIEQQIEQDIYNEN